ncbi:arylsulfatase B [Carboxylicivirga sp. RSCT41]|uniref:arylsulfatase B n=1 Tax=Carboxylicivirga agarovorans TaxID=3417570 RepID=UPI003D337249
MFLSTIHIIVAQKQPNIIFILADDMGYSDMSWQSSVIETPNLDRLKSEGLFLERHYTQPQCTPTRVSFLTGNYPYRYGLHEHIVLPYSYTGIPGEEKTIAEKMKEGGYKTAIVGKWHVGGRKQSFLPHHQGFDHSFVCINGSISYWNYTHGGKSDMIRNGKKIYAPSMVNKEESGNRYSTYMFADEAVDLIDNHDKKQPLFMYLPFTAPHHPLDAPQNKLDKYPLDQIEDYWAGMEAEKGRTAKTRQYYMAMVDAMDEAIGNVLGALEKNGMKENTLIVFTSDNGGIIEADNRPLRSIKGDAFEGGIRTPAIVFWPGNVKPNSKSSELIHVSDWYSTFADAAGIEYKNEDLDGTSALNIIKGGKGNRDHIAIISEQRHALINDNYALVGNSNNYLRSMNNELNSFRLYDIDSDVTQTKSIHDSQDEKAHMQEQLLAYFPKVNRGDFNWDIKYARYRKEKKTFDHSYDNVINDLPEIDINNAGNKTKVTLSPACDKLVYKLQGTQDGKNWNNLGEYVCRENAEAYTFPALPKDKIIVEYRVLTDMHFGLPIHDSFSADKGYKTGDSFAGTVDRLPNIAGFLTKSDVAGGENIRIIDKSLKYKAYPQKGGALNLKSTNKIPEVYLTRYFQEPLNTGKVYLAMLLQYQALESESTAQINFLVQNGWGGNSEKQVSLSIQNDAIYCNQVDVPNYEKNESWLANYHNEVMHVVFEFDLGATGQDKLNIFINPEKGPKMEATASYFGEFTFDRLQFKVAGRPGGDLTVDDLKIGRSFKDVWFYNETATK